uniref:Uncharacterized protein n=1 Tax=Eutreptiella gymnastica TaxID=73025 RepID=A0A6T2CX05_9EUGL
MCLKWEKRALSPLSPGTMQLFRTCLGWQAKVCVPVPNPPRRVVVNCGVGGPEPSSSPYQCRCKSCCPPTATTTTPSDPSPVTLWVGRAAAVSGSFLDLM